MRKVVISDTSCLILLSKIEELHLLERLYSEVMVSEEIAEEFGEPLPPFIKIQSVKDKQKQILLEMQIDKGESSGIALAMEIEHSVLIIDDYKARKIAERLNIAFTGTLGVIISAKQKGIIVSIKPLLEKMKQTNFRISEALEREAIKLANED